MSCFALGCLFAIHGSDLHHPLVWTTCDKVHCNFFFFSEAFPRQKLTESKSKRAWSVAQVMVVAYSIQDSLMACSDSCQKQSTQIITWPGQPTKCTVACKIRFSTDDFREWQPELRFLSNGVSWEDALGATKSGRFEECGCGKSWKKSSTAWWIWRTAVDFFWCVDSANTIIQISNVLCFHSRPPTYQTRSCKKSLIISLRETAMARCLVPISQPIFVMFNAT